MEVPQVPEGESVDGAAGTGLTVTVICEALLQQVVLRS
jgi:hypothetical protein